MMQCVCTFIDQLSDELQIVRHMIYDEFYFETEMMKVMSFQEYVISWNLKSLLTGTAT